MYRSKIIISYDGTEFSGWQIQPNAPSIQQHLEEALGTLTREKVRVIGSGRTDAGVHALGQVAHFDTSAPFDQLHALNGLLPHTIRVLELTPISDDFHAQYSATGKSYHYHVWTQRMISPFVRNYRYYAPYDLDFQALEDAAQLFIGTHDFATFANVGGSSKTTIRTLHAIKIVEQEGGFRLEFHGEGFLYKMVRNITGTLLGVATKKRALDSILELFAAKDRRVAGKAAPAKGLFLVKVDYAHIFCSQDSFF